MILQHFGSLRLPSRNPFDLRVKIIVVLQLGIISDHDVGRAESSSDAADHHLPNCASRSMLAEGRYPDLRGNTCYPRSLLLGKRCGRATSRHYRVAI